MEPPGGEPPEVPAPPSSGVRRLTTERLYTENWQFVFQLLPTFGVYGLDQEDVAQSVWQSIHAQIASFDPVRQSSRAWITGFVRRCASNYRRRKRRKPEMPMEEPGVLSAAPGLNPEEMTLLRTLHQAIPDEDRREALVLQIRHGLTVDEIAAVTGVSKGKIEWRLQMAKEELNDDDKGEKSKGAFLGFGSLDALVEALRPQPIPFDRGARLWIRVADAIRHPGADKPGGARHSRRKYGALVAGAFLMGATAGVIAGLLWQTPGSSEGQNDKPPRGAALVDSSPAQQASSPVVAAAPTASAAPSLVASASAAASGSVSASLAAPVVTPTGSVSSELMILRMRRGIESGKYAEVLELVERHARQFPVQQADEREDLRIRALVALDRVNEAEQRAQQEAQQHPERRLSVERALGHRLP